VKIDAFDCAMLRSDLGAGLATGADLQAAHGKALEGYQA